MKIGIITFHRAENFGAMLQAVALRQALASLGHDACFLDYWPKHHDEVYRIWDVSAMKRMRFLTLAHFILANTLSLPLKWPRKKKFRQFVKTHIEPFCIPFDTPVDVVVTGSDQVWGRFPFFNNRIDPMYLDDPRIHAARRISYAASMGDTNFNTDERRFIQSHLKNFDRISVREADARHLLCELGFSQAELTCDPTLLLPAEEWIELVAAPRLIKEPYALFYDFQQGAFHTESLVRFARSRGLQLVSIAPWARRSADYECRIVNSAGPAEFLSLIRNAEHVFTSSFHGLAFSIIFQREFHAAFNVRANRAQTLLDTLGLSDRLVDSRTDLMETSFDSIDYTAAAEKLKPYVAGSKQFLADLNNA